MLPGSTLSLIINTFISFKKFIILKTGTLEQCKAWEKIDVDKINEIIQLNYNLDYGTVDINKSVKEIYNSVNYITKKVKELTVVKKDYNDQRFLINSCIELQNLLVKIINQNDN